METRKNCGSLNQYTILERIGSGSTAAVYEAIDNTKQVSDTNYRLAIKLFSEQISDESNRLIQIENLIMQAIPYHKNLVGLLEYGSAIYKQDGEQGC